MGENEQMHTSCRHEFRKAFTPMNVGRLPSRKSRSVSDAWTSSSGCGCYLQLKTFVSKWKWFSPDKMYKAISGEDDCHSRSSTLGSTEFTRTALQHVLSPTTLAATFCIWKRIHRVSQSRCCDLERAQILRRIPSRVLVELMHWLTHRRGQVLSKYFQWKEGKELRGAKRHELSHGRKLCICYKRKLLACLDFWEKLPSQWRNCHLRTQTWKRRHKALEQCMPCAFWGSLVFILLVWDKQASGENTSSAHTQTEGKPTITWKCFSEVETPKWGELAVLMVQGGVISIMNLPGSAEHTFLIEEKVNGEARWRKTVPCAMPLPCKTIRNGSIVNFAGKEIPTNCYFLSLSLFERIDDWCCSCIFWNSSHHLIVSN